MRNIYILFGLIISICFGSIYYINKYVEKRDRVSKIKTEIEVIKRELETADLDIFLNNSSAITDKDIKLFFFDKKQKKTSKDSINYLKALHAIDKNLTKNYTIYTKRLKTALLRIDSLNKKLKQYE